MSMAADAANYLEEIGGEVVRACKERGWRLDWSARGAYLFLESAELIEAFRGKGDSPPAEEAADVLLVLLSIMNHHGLAAADVLVHVERKLEKIRAGAVGRDGDR